MLVFYDFETTGLNQFHDRITEMSFVKNDNSNYTTLVNPQIKIPPFITRITKISNDMVIDKPTFKEALPGMYNFLSNNGEQMYLVAHNSDGFDYLVLKAHLNREGIKIKDLGYKYIDTLLLAKKLYPQFFKHNLTKLCVQLGLQVEEAHRAYADCKMLKRLYVKICEDLATHLKATFDEVFNNPELVISYTHD